MRLGTHILKEEEIDQLYRSIRNHLKNFSEELRTGRIDAEDVAQEAMISLYRWGKAYHGSIANWEKVEGYLYGVVRNSVRSEMRKRDNSKDRLPLRAEDMEGGTPVHYRKSLDELIPPDTLKNMTGVLRGIPLREREIIAQLFRGKTNSEIAIRMGKEGGKPGAVKMAGGRLIMRSLDVFAQRLEEQGHIKEAELIRNFGRHRTMHGPNPQEIFLHLREAHKRRRRARPLHRRV